MPVEASNTNPLRLHFTLSCYTRVARPGRNPTKMCKVSNKLLVLLKSKKGPAHARRGSCSIYSVHIVLSSSISTTVFAFVQLVENK